MEIDNLIYENIQIKVDYNKECKTFHARSIVGSSHSKYDSKLNNFDYGFAPPKEAIENVKIVIDDFLKNTPKNYTELAEVITNSLVWTGYEDCHVDEQVIEIIINNFIKYNTIKP